MGPKLRADHADGARRARPDPWVGINNPILTLLLEEGCRIDCERLSFELACGRPRDQEGRALKQDVELYVAHRRALLTYANRIVRDPGRAEDVVQEAFLRLRTAAAANLLDEPVAYLYRIVRNLALDLQRHLTFEGLMVGAVVAAITAIRLRRRC
ncbi:MAG: hypothetical protein GEV13_07290 [Rhodospirillales bacterium]|nr:hypothetical protein [Rhodospirillales bacterium]